MDNRGSAVGSWAHYDALDEARLGAELFDFPTRISDARWLEIVEKVALREEKRVLDFHLCACLAAYDDDTSAARRAHPDRAVYETDMRAQFVVQAKAEGDRERAILSNTDLVRIENGERILDVLEAAQAIFKYVAVECGVQHVDTDNIIHDAAGDAIAQHLIGDSMTPARDTWRRFLALLGYPRCPEPLPWWVIMAYPSDHYLGIMTSDNARALTRDIRANKLDALAAESLGKHVVDVLSLIAQAGSDNRTIIAIETAT